MHTEMPAELVLPSAEDGKETDSLRQVDIDYPIPKWITHRNLVRHNFKSPYDYQKTFSGRYGTINFFVTGNLSHPIILCFHGLNGNWSTFSSFHLICPRYNYAVVSFDLYGHGLSANVAQKYRSFGCSSKKSLKVFSLDFFIKQTEEVLNHLKISDQRADITLVGFSMGGIIALGYAIKHPTQVARLFLICTAGLMQRRIPFRIQFLKLFRSCIIPASPLCVCSFCVSRRSFFRQFSQEEIENGTAEAIWEKHIWYLYVKKGAVQSFLGCVAELPVWLAPSLFSQVGSLNLPVLLVWGQNDTLAVPVDIKIVKKYIKNSHCIVFPRGTHLLIAEKPRSLLALLMVFCTTKKEDSVEEWISRLSLISTRHLNPLKEKFFEMQTKEDNNPMACL